MDFFHSFRSQSKRWAVIFLSVSTFASSVCHGFEQSIAPVAGYSPTYSLALGAGYFFQGEDVSGRLIGVYTLTNCFQVQPRLEVKLTSWFEWDTDIKFQKGFEPYYGEGPSTSIQNRTDFRSYHSETVSGIRFNTSDNFSFSPRVGLRSYHATDGNQNPFNPGRSRLVSPALGADFRWDFRGKKEKLDEGFFQETEIWISPGWSEASVQSFATVEARITEGVTLFSDARVVMTAALGGAVGEADYAYRFRLGGSSRLRGYLENRFRGKYFYLQGTELRVPLSQMFALGFFGEVGEATDQLGPFHPKFSYGAGLRVALPPDRVQWARLDVGFGQDSWALYADFGLPF